MRTEVAFVLAVMAWSPLVGLCAACRPPLNLTPAMLPACDFSPALSSFFYLLEYVCKHLDTIK